jgi:8-oxo-dGTP diphosphatase
MQEYRGTKDNPFHISCGGVIWRKNKKGEIEILLLHRLKKRGWPYNSWHLPKGTRRKTETTQEAVKREVLEETGYQVKVLKKISSLKSSYWLDQVKINKTTHYYLCQPIGRVKKQISEHDEIKWVPFAKAKKLLSLFPQFEEEEKILFNL